MTQGLKVWGPNGQVWMDTSLTTWNLVEAFEVGAGGYAVRNYGGDLSNMEFMAIQVPLEVPRVDSYTYEKTINVYGGGLVVVSGGNQSALIVVMCR